MEKVIALLGQPNSGKTSLFNGLTGSHQHVGNWPGKTVEKREGIYEYQNEEYRIVDLPGSYSLTSVSDEEVITTSYITSNEADLILLLVDASQLERSLYMYTDYIGIQTPVLLVLNLMDIAEKKGIQIDIDALKEKLHIPVIGFVASDIKRYGTLKEAVKNALEDHLSANEEDLMQIYMNDPSIDFSAMMKEEHATDVYSPFKLAMQKMEQSDQGLMTSGKHKYAYIDFLLKDTVTLPLQEAALEKFDQKALKPVRGKWIAFGILILALLGAMIIASPLMAGGFVLSSLISSPLHSLMTMLHVWQPVAELVYVVLPNVLAFTIAMAGFVLGITFIFALVEDVGYMARISFIFNSAMEKLGLQGKSMCSLLMSLGCNMAGVAGSRVIDSTGQRFLTLLLVWSIPCGTTLSLAPMLATVFYGPVGGFLIMLLVAGITIGSLFLCSKIFSRYLINEDESNGILMELPPYHKPNWRHITRTTLIKAKDIFARAFQIIMLVSVIFYVLSYNWFNGNSILSIIGQTIEPVTKVFGMTWQMFMAYLSSMLTKESLLGVLNALYSNTDMIDAAFNAKSIGLSESMMVLLPQIITKAQALGFIAAIVFNVPCTMTVAATFRENHSKKWIGLSILYYLVFSLALAFIFYHIGLLIWPA